MTDPGLVRTCISCGAKLKGKNRSKEHVIPSWLLEALDLRDEGLLQILANSEKRSIDGERKHALDSFQQGRVCRYCNGGWMSDLEVSAKPIILGLIRLERGLLSLTASESLTLAGWALKTACVLTSTTLVERPLDPAYLAEMRNGTQGFPSGVAVLAMQMTTALKFNFLEKIDWPVFLPEQNMPVPEEIENALKVSFQVGGLFFLIACPPPNAKLALAAGIHVPLWPEMIFPSYKSRLGLTPDNPLTLLEKFSDSLGLLLD